MTEHVEALLTGRAGAATGAEPATSNPAVAAFVCEEDVRQALALGRTIMIGERTIVTPLARDLGEAHKVLVTAGWPDVTVR